MSSLAMERRVISFCVFVVSCIPPGHLAGAASRRALKLEEHWTAASRPQVQLDGLSKNRRKAEKQYDDTLEELCNRFPPPEDYNVFDADNAEAWGTRAHTSGFTFTKVPPGIL